MDGELPSVPTGFCKPRPGACAHELTLEIPMRSDHYSTKACRKMWAAKGQPSKFIVIGGDGENDKIHTEEENSQPLSFPCGCI